MYSGQGSPAAAQFVPGNPSGTGKPHRQLEAQLLGS